MSNITQLAASFLIPVLTLNAQLADLPAGFRFTTVTIQGATQYQAGGISNNGLTTGSYRDGTRWRGYRRLADGSIATFDAQNSGDTTPLGINNAGRIVGSTTANAKTSGFIREPGGSITLFDFPGAVSTTLAGINDAGIMAGSFTDSANIVHGFTMTMPDDVRVFDVGAGTKVTSISSTGAVGGATGGSASGGFLRSADGSTTTSITVCGPGTRGGGVTAVFANASQTIAGNCLASSGTVFYNRFLRAPNGRTTIENVIALDFYGGINDSGQVTLPSVILTPCTVSPTLTVTNVPAASNTVIVPVQGEAGCRPVATESEEFLALSTITDNTVSIFVAENTSGIARTLHAWVAGSEVTITQAGVPCNAALTGGPALFNSTGGTGMLNLTLPTGCTWNATSNSGWITFTSATSGTGSGTLNFSVAANAAQAIRNGAVTVAGSQFSIIQTAAPCVNLLSQSGFQFSQLGGTATFDVTTTPACSWTPTPSDSWITISGGSTPRSGNGSVTFTVAANAFSTRVATINIAGVLATVTQQGVAEATPLRFVPVTPCRVADTRADSGKSGAFGPPRMAATTSRDFAIPQSGCGIPSTARAYSLNITVVPPGPLSFLTAWPAGSARPNVSTLNSFNGRVVANAAIVPAGTNAAISIFVTDATDVVIDINGYFVPVDVPQSLAFYPVTPCRAVDTRIGQQPIPGQTFQSFDIVSSGCGVPPSAQAFALNATAVPPAYLGFLTLWPTGQPRPNASTLNSWDGQVVANMTIVPVGANGAVSVYASNATDVVLDITGYFAPPGQPGALNFYTRPPCRIADTRNTSMIPGQTLRSFAMGDGGCVPAEAKAYSVNVTAVPPGYLGYLTMWPFGAPQPLVSTLNSWNGQVVANAALVPAGSGGAVSVYVSNPSHVVIDANGYFAP